MLGGSHYWIILALGTLWASFAPRRMRETGLALLAFALVLDHSITIGLIYLAATTLVWWLISKGSPRFFPLAITGLTAWLLTSEIVERVPAGDYLSPLGLSYLVFRLINVVVDARRNAWDRPPGLMEFFHFMFTPALFVAGPLERWGHWETPPVEDRKQQIAAGVWRILIGLLKKMYLADLFLPFLARQTHWAVPESITPETGAPQIWQACLFAYLKIYAEFSGYSDIAVGTALLWGRRPMENFNWPIIAATPSDFWRRWHISIAQWCSNCIYLPVMGLMRSVIVPMLASFIVMGLWHGLGFNRVGWALWQVGGLLVFITWQKRMGRPKKGSWRTRWSWKLAGIGMTQAFIVASYAFMLHGETVPITASLGLIARMLGWKS